MCIASISTQHYVHNTQLERKCRVAAETKFDDNGDNEVNQDDLECPASSHGSVSNHRIQSPFSHPGKMMGYPRNS